MKKSDWSDVALFVGVVAGISLFFWTFIAGMCAIDEDYFDPIDNDGTCYVRVVEVNNWWLTPGKSYTVRDTYCKEK